jgi:hypothetical protein
MVETSGNDKRSTNPKNPLDIIQQVKESQKDQERYGKVSLITV